MSERRTVLLYNPRAVFYTMPLGLLAVGSHLDPERYRVVIVDGRLEEDPIVAMAPWLDDAVCVGMSVLTGDPIRDAVSVSRAIKAKRADVPIVWGGWHPSMFGSECLAEPAVDVTVQRQGEATFVELVERLAAGDSLDGCAGITHRGADGALRVEAPRVLLDVNEFRPHDFTLLDVDRYFALKGRRQLDYISSQGCPFRCAFCADPFVYGRKWFGLDPERMGDELEALWRAYRFEDLSFQDETFFTYPKRVSAIADELIRRRLPITWAATLRADQCARMSEDLFERCRASGMRRVLVGVEAGTQELMDRIKKDITLDQVFLTAERCQRHGVAVIFPFIVGFPDEPEHSVQASLDVAKRLRAMSPDFQTPFFFFKPYPGSEITDDAVRGGYSLPCSLDEWAEFDFIGSAGPWVSADMRRRVERFLFYQQVAYNRGRSWQAPVRRLARWRCENDRYGWPVEKIVGEWLRPPEALS